MLIFLLVNAERDYHTNASLKSSIRVSSSISPSLLTDSKSSLACSAVKGLGVSGYLSIGQLFAKNL